MNFTGHYIGGQIVPDVPLALPDGAAVSGMVSAAANDEAGGSDASDSSGTRRTLRDRLKNFLSHTVDLPPDAATNHDYYLVHGLPDSDESDP
jgi:hypothetical protein